MKYLTGEDRRQIPLFVGCLEEAIKTDNEVWLVDAFLASGVLVLFALKLVDME